MEEEPKTAMLDNTHDLSYDMRTVACLIQERPENAAKEIGQAVKRIIDWAFQVQDLETEVSRLRQKLTELTERAEQDAKDKQIMKAETPQTEGPAETRDTQLHRIEEQLRLQTATVLYIWCVQTGVSTENKVDSGDLLKKSLPNIREIAKSLAE